MKVLQTKFDGHYFRSRLEARWAVFFKCLGIPYLYEPEGFDLEEAGYYLPDFFLPGIPCRNLPKNQKGIWIEVKPCAPDKTYRKKLWSLVEHTQHTLILLIGAVSTGEDVVEEFEEYRLAEARDHLWSVHDTGMIWHQCHDCGKVKIDWGHKNETCYDCGWRSSPEHTLIPFAVTAALSERFGT